MSTPSLTTYAILTNAIALFFLLLRKIPFQKIYKIILGLNFRKFREQTHQRKNMLKIIQRTPHSRSRQKSRAADVLHALIAQDRQYPIRHTRILRVT